MGTIITRECWMTKKDRHIEIDMDPVKFSIAEEARNSGQLIQDAFPDLSPAEREFIKTGGLPEDIGLETVGITILTTDEVEAKRGKGS